MTAGYATAACVFAGSLARPIGGALADRTGGVRALSVMYTIAGVALTIVSLHLSQMWSALGVFVVAMMALGMGTGPFSSLCPSAFAKRSVS